MKHKVVGILLLLVLLVVVSGCTYVPKSVLDEIVVTYDTDINGQVLRHTSYTNETSGKTVICTERNVGYWEFDGCVGEYDPPSQ